MALWLMFGTVLVAILLWRYFVPNISIDEPDAPAFDSLVTTRSTVAVAVLTGASSLVLWITPATSWWLWLPYLSLATPLICVDALTTYLPLTFHRLVAAGMAVGFLGFLSISPTAAGIALLCAVASYAIFLVVYWVTQNFGFGDVRLAGVVGLVAGQTGVLTTAHALLYGTLAGALYGVIHALWAARSSERAQHFAYGPALWAGPLLATVFPGS